MRLANHRQTKDLRDEGNQVILIFKRHGHFDIELVHRLGHRLAAGPKVPLIVDYLGHLLRDLEIRVVLIEHEGDSAVLGEVAGEVFQKLASTVDSA